MNQFVYTHLYDRDTYDKIPSLCDYIDYTRHEVIDVWFASHFDLWT